MLANYQQVATTADQQELDAEADGDKTNGGAKNQKQVNHLKKNNDRLR